MKKTFYQIGMLAVAALAFLACNKETEVNQNTGDKHYATISLSKTEDTKTMVDESGSKATYKWNDDDDQYIHVYENGTAGTVESFVLNTEKTVATLTVSFTGTPTAPYSYEAKYAKTLSGSKNPLIPAEQSPLNSTFDPAADVLVSKTISDDSNRLTELTFTMGRPATVNKMTLTGLTAGEVISKVEFTLDKAFVGGYVSYDTDNSTYKYNSSSKKLTLNYTATTGVVPAGGQFPVYFVCAPVVAAPIISVVVTTDQNVYTKSTSCTPNPFDGKSITFEIGKMKRFTMSMANYGEAVGTATNYTLVEDADKIADGGEYIFVSTKKDDAGLCAASSYGTGSNYYYTATDVTASNKVIAIDAQPAMVFTLEAGTTAGQYYIVDSDGKYLYWDSGNTVKRGDKGATDAYLWSISLTDGIQNVGTTERKLQYNSGSPRFACYTSVQTTISLYVNESTIISSLSTPQNLTATDAGGGTVNVYWDAVTDADSYTVTLGETSQTGITTTSTSFNSVADGTYTVTVTAISNDHTVAIDSQAASTTVKVGTPALGKPVIASFTETATGFSAEIAEAIQYAASYDWTLYEGSVDANNVHGLGNTTTLSFSVPFTSPDVDIDAFTPGTTYYLVVTAKADGYTATDSDAASFVAATPSYDFTTIAKLNELASALSNNETADYEGTLTDVIVSYRPDDNNAIIKDNTGSILVYNNSGHGLLQGQTFTGELNVTVKMYYTTIEITSIDATFSGSGSVVAPANMTLDQLVGNFTTYQNAYVQVDNLTVTGRNGKNISVRNSANTKTYVVYDNGNTSPAATGDVLSVVGTVGDYSGTNQVKAWSSDDITITTYADRAITFTQPTQTGCSFTVNAGSGNITSGTTVAYNTTVTLTATAGDGYTFNGWTVTGATVADDSAPTTTFKMGHSPVSIIAVFNEIGNTTHYYVKVTDLSTLSADDVILIINPNHDALPAFTSNATQSATDLHTSYYDSVNDRYSSQDAAVNACAITLVNPTTAINNKVVFKLKMSNNYFIFMNKSETKFSASTTSTAVTGDWTFTIDAGVATITNNSQTSRAILWSTALNNNVPTNKFGAYATSNLSGNNASYYSGVYIYKLN